MATTTTIRATRSAFGSCARECDTGGVFLFRALYDGYRACRRHKRGTANVQRYELRLLDPLVDTARTLQGRAYTPTRPLQPQISSIFQNRQRQPRKSPLAD